MCVGRVRVGLAKKLISGNGDGHSSELFRSILCSTFFSNTHVTSHAPTLLDRVLADHHRTLKAGQLSGVLCKEKEASGG